jgi:hypothetical protein
METISEHFPHSQAEPKPRNLAKSQNCKTLLEEHPGTVAHVVPLVSYRD